MHKQSFSTLEISVHNSVRAGYCVGSFQKLYMISFIMPRNETEPVALQICRREFSICWRNNTRFAAFNKHIKEGHATVSF